MRKSVLIPLVLMGTLRMAGAISITIDYSNPSDSFFTAQAQATLAKAAADVSFAITTSLSALNQDVYTGSVGGSTATADWRLTYKNPYSATATVTQNTFSFAQDEVVVKVGSRSLSGSTLGQGGPGGGGASLSGGSASSESFAASVDAMELASNAGMLRGGPTLSGISGSFGPETYELSYGYSLSSLVFNSDPSTFWNFSYNDLPTTSQSDFYSVAVHELLHALGFGSAGTWTEKVSGTDWSGAAVNALLGTGTDVVDAGGAHVATGLQGFAIIDGVVTATKQDAVMSPSITQGTRKYITDLDLAFLSDMGWEVVPEPSTSILLLSAGGLLLLGRRRS
ncbi:MAG: PEP-CTERM sorting domain-containing protein [Luteolibacter sp.]